jgi:hypothetical protein
MPSEGLRTEAKPGLVPEPVRANEPTAAARRSAEPATGSHRLTVARFARRVPATRRTPGIYGVP